MILSQSQLNTLEAWVIANNANIFDQSAVNALNANASPDFWVWRTSVEKKEIVQDPGYNWTRVDNLSVGKSRIWSELFEFLMADPSKPNVRAGIDAVWVGTQADLDVRAVVYVHCRRLATVAEKLFATGTGSTAVPATMGPEGAITIDNVVAAGS